MIKLLLVTWNAVAHEKLDMDETEPQLAYVAYSMTLQGKQKITKDELAKSIIEARKELPELLGYTNLSPAKFMVQVEERSSLLIQLGLEENEKGRLVPSYEFSHLSFQEYLAAKAVAEGWIPKADETTIIDIIKAHLNEEHWKEVIPMIAVLSGRKSREIIEFLLQKCREFESKYKKGLLSEKEFQSNIAPFHLANCVASEVPINMDMLEEAIDFIIKGKRNIDKVVRESSDYTYIGSIYDIILKSKYGEKYSSIVNDKLFDDFDKKYLYEYCEAWLRTNLNIDISIKDIEAYFNGTESEEYIKGTLLMMHYSYRLTQPMRKQKKRNLDKIDKLSLNKIFNKVYELLKQDDELSLFTATWCLGWSGYNESDIVPENLYNCLFERLIELWESNISYKELERTISWALRTITKPCLKFDHIDIDKLINCIERKYNNPQNEFDTDVSIMLAFLSGYCNVRETAKRINLSAKNIYRHGSVAPFWEAISTKSKLIDKELKKIKESSSKH